MYWRCISLRSISKTTPFQLLCQRHTITLTASFFFYIDTDTHSFYVIEQWKFYINTDNFMHIHKMPIFEAITLLTYPKAVKTVAMKVNGFWIYIYFCHIFNMLKKQIFQVQVWRFQKLQIEFIVTTFSEHFMVLFNSKLKRMETFQPAFDNGSNFKQTKLN